MLLIDDSVEILRLMEVRLRVEDVVLLLATSGPEGIRIAQTRRPSLILVDLDMPVMDGFETLRALKDDERTAAIPVIVISGSEETEDKVAGFELGAVDYVCKPFNIPELRARIRSALRIDSLMQMLSKRAQIDGLTGLWNRAHFDQRLAEHIHEQQRSGAPFTLVMCDLDHFKSLNDTHGHPAGDYVLQAFAKLLNSSIRVTDMACRYGGEEFAIILREMTADQAHAMIDRIRAALEEIRWPRHPERTLTASFGVCDRPSGAPTDPVNWIENADRALYQAKSQGRNRVVLSDGSKRLHGLKPGEKPAPTQRGSDGSTPLAKAG